MFGDRDAGSQPQFDLSRGLDTFVKYDETTDLHIDALLETIEKHEGQIGKKVDADIVTWRGMMTKESLHSWLSWLRSHSVRLNW
jgi:RAT1-interacting protein